VRSAWQVMEPSETDDRHGNISQNDRNLLSMDAGDFFKSAVDSFDKVTDILNVGRLIFYTAAGFFAILPVAMSLRLLAYNPLPTYWNEFAEDLRHCAGRGGLWAAALIFGFVIANVANNVVIHRFTPPPRSEPAKDSFPYAYPRLYSGGIRPKDGTPKDYAAWLISEYYRYVEIAVFVPFGILLSLPVYSIYSLVYLVKTAAEQEAFVLNGCHVALASWTLASVAAWKVIWPDFWLPRVAEPVYRDWVIARRSAIAGLREFADGTQPPPDKASEQVSPSKK
jgi:hypothetical protein